MSTPTPPRDEWPGAARAAALLYLARLALGWGEPLGAEELVLDAAIWWGLFSVGFVVMPARPDIWARLFAVVAMALAAFLSFAGLSITEAVLGAVVTLVMGGLLLGRDVGPPQTAGLTGVLAVPVGLVFVLRGFPEAMPGIAFLTLLVLLVGHRDLRWAGALAVGASLVGIPNRPPTWRADGEVPPGPDIVLVVVDSLRADAARDMSTVKRLVAGGGEDLDGFAPTPWTLPSMATLMTGAPPEQHGAGLGEDGVARIAPGHVTLGRTLHERGYDTAAVLAENGYLARRFGLLDGLAEVRGGIGRGAELVFRLDNRGRRVASRALREAGLVIPLWGRGWGIEEATVEVGEILERRRDRPLFLWVHLMDAHMPWEDAPGGMSSLRRDFVLADPYWQAHPEELRAAHAVQMAAVDAGLSDLVAELGPPPPHGRVLVITSDHGEELYEHGGFEHGHAYWQELLAVPIILQGVQLHPTARIHPIGLADVHATMVHAAGAERVGQGRALQDELEARVLTGQAKLYGTDGFAVVRGRHKLIADEGRVQLFDLDDDPHERHDLAASQPELVGALLALAPAEAVAGPVVPLSQQEQSQLEALGYQLPDKAHQGGH